MKALSKPLSSPGRTDKFPPPLMMRFLRSNVGSRSRGKSRSSPMLYLRTRKTLPGPTEPTQEPSSPKVTCIGQVRVRRSSSSKSNPKKPAGKVTRRRWLKIKTLFCGKSSLTFSTTHKRPFRRIFNKWGSFFRSGYCKKKVDATEDSLRKKIENKENVDASVYNSNSNNNNNRTNSSTSGGESEYSVNKYENIGGGSLESRRKFLECSSSSSSTPPTNALILTRCRSVPYRSSSLGGIFWASAFAHQEVENAERLEEVEVEVEEKAAVICRKISEKSESNLEKNVEDLKRVNVHPLVLMRCKSEPARTGERLNQEFNTTFSRLDNVVHSRSHPNS